MAMWFFNWAKVNDLGNVPAKVTYIETYQVGIQELV